MAVLREGMMSTLADCGNDNKTLILSFNFLHIKDKTGQDEL